MTQALPNKNLVLYADDDPDDIELIRDVFEEFSDKIKLVTFENGKKLLQYIQSLDELQPQPCLVILDINMPVLNGKETLQNLRRLPPHQDLPVVLFSTSTLPSDANFARSLNAGFITKPLQTSQISTLVDRFLDHCTDDVRKFLKKN